jgi:uncharacterized protein YlxW (UPF0749 family)
MNAQTRMITMYRARVALPILLGCIVALWGCTPRGQTPTADKSLETRVSKLEKELKTVQEQNVTLAAQLRVEQAKSRDVTSERDEARNIAKARAEELDSVRKGLKEMIGRVDAALAPPTPGKGTTSTDVSSLPVIELR